MIDRGEERIWRRNNCVNDRGMLNAAHVKSLFADLVRGAVQELRYGGYAVIENLYVGGGGLNSYTSVRFGEHVM